MSGSNGFRETTDARGAATSPGRRALKRPPLMREVASHFVFKFEFLFLETVEKVFVRVGSVLFLLDEGVKSGMLRFESLGHCLIHWWRSFQSACHRCVINHDSNLLSRP